MIRVGNFWGNLNDWLYHTHIFTQSGLGVEDDDDVLIVELLTSNYKVSPRGRASHSLFSFPVSIILVSLVAPGM